MPTDRDIKLVKAALEAADAWLLKWGWTKPHIKVAEIIDPAAIVALVPESEPWVGPPDLYEENRRLQKELAAQRADVNHLNQMLRDKGYGQGEIDAYAAQCDELDAMRQRIAELERQLADREGRK